MALFRAEVKVFSRSSGTSAVENAAYRAGACLTDDTTGLTHDYRRKGGVVAAETFLPAEAPEAFREPGALWNAAERAEKRKDSRVARELLIALPHELDEDQRLALAREVSAGLVARYGVGVLMAVHAPDKGGDARNHHAHLLFTTRAVEATGLSSKKTRALDDKTTGPLEVEAMREMVETLTNQRLAAAGLSVRVDRRSLKEQQADAIAQGDFVRAVELDRRPTLHQGPYATHLARCGEYSPRVEHNARVLTENDQHRRAIADRTREIREHADWQGTLVAIDEQAAHAIALDERWHGKPAARVPAHSAAPLGPRLRERRQKAPAGLGKARTATAALPRLSPALQSYLRGLEECVRAGSDFFRSWLATCRLTENTKQLEAYLQSQTGITAWTADIARLEQEYDRARTRPTRRREAELKAGKVARRAERDLQSWRQRNPQPLMILHPLKWHEWTKQEAAKVDAFNAAQAAHIAAVRHTTGDRLVEYQQRAEAAQERLQQRFEERREHFPLPSDEGPRFPWGPPAPVPENAPAAGQKNTPPRVLPTLRPPR